MIYVEGIPSSIDNDIPFFENSLSFETATTEAVTFITAANVEAEGCELGIGIVRFMDFCFITASACLSSRELNINHGVYESYI